MTSIWIGNMFGEEENLKNIKKITRVMMYVNTFESCAWPGFPNKDC